MTETKSIQAGERTQRIISFKVTRAENTIIAAIAARADEMARRQNIGYDRMTANMDITACHANGNRLDLKKLLAADDFNFAHDVFGIARHIDRRTGKLTGFFSPRCSAAM